MSRARDLSKLANPSVFSVDSSNNVGLNSTSPDAARKLAAAIEITTTVNIADIETDVAQRRLVLKLKKGALKQKGMTPAEVKDKLERALRLYVEADKEKNPSTLTLIPGVQTEDDMKTLAENPPSYTELLQVHRIHLLSRHVLQFLCMY